MTSIPDWLEPMAATLTQERFTGPEWIFERKFDGIRLLAFKQGPDIRLFSRNRLPQNIPSIAQAIASLPVHDAIFDGEATWESGVAYHVFDIMWLDGRDLMSLPLETRRTLLSELPLQSPLQRVTLIDEPAPWERARNEGWEGVIAKRRDSPYEQRRSKHWLKMKCEARQDFVVGGFTDPQGGRVGLGALLVGYFEKEDFIFAGRVGTGFDTKLLLDLRARLDALEIAKSPFTTAVGLPRVRAHWVRPEIVVHVAFIEWTVHGKLRHSRLLGLRANSQGDRGERREDIHREIREIGENIRSRLINTAQDKVTGEVQHSQKVHCVPRNARRGVGSSEATRIAVPLSTAAGIDEAVGHPASCACGRVGEEQSARCHAVPVLHRVGLTRNRHPQRGALVFQHQPLCDGGLDQRDFMWRGALDVHRHRKAMAVRDRHDFRPLAAFRLPRMPFLAIRLLASTSLQ